MIPAEIALERFLADKHARHEASYANLISRIAVEDLNPDHVYRWLVDWMNRQLADICVNSTGQQTLPPLHFDLVKSRNNGAAAHVFKTEEFGFIVVTEAMVEEMFRLSRLLVQQNAVFMNLQIAPSATLQELAQLLLLMQFCLVVSHEYSHLVRRHLEDQPNASDFGESLAQVQELDADGFGIYHGLTYFFRGEGRRFASTLLRISSDKALDNSILSCFLLAIMMQFCARWAGKMQVQFDGGVEYPPHAVRIEYSILFVEMWCREVGSISTLWMTDGTLQGYFGAAARLFVTRAKISWDSQIQWLKSRESEQYRILIRRGLEQIRTGRG